MTPTKLGADLAFCTQSGHKRLLKHPTYYKDPVQTGTAQRKVTTRRSVQVSTADPTAVHKAQTSDFAWTISKVQSIDYWLAELLSELCRKIPT